MAKENSGSSQGIRERHLNVVYFIDSSRSHSVRINLTLARWILASGLGVLLWSIISIGWIVSLGQTLESTRTHLTKALSSVFNYQVKYDHVFETAYPDGSTHAYYSPGSQSSENNPVNSQAGSSEINVPVAAPPVQVQATNATPKISLEEIKKPAVAASVPVKAELSSLTDSKEKSLSISIKNTRLSAYKGKMILLFDIMNVDPKRKAEGYIWATATLVLADGTTKRIAAPGHSKINLDGTVDAYRTTYKFSIQRFKMKDFQFSVPQDETWKIQDMKISYSDTGGGQRQSENVTAVLKFQQPNAGRETTITKQNQDPSAKIDETESSSP